MPRNAAPSAHLVLIQYDLLPNVRLSAFVELFDCRGGQSSLMLCPTKLCIREGSIHWPWMCACTLGCERPNCDPLVEVRGCLGCTRERFVGALNLEPLFLVSKNSFGVFGRYPYFNTRPFGVNCLQLKASLQALRSFRGQCGLSWRPTAPRSVWSTLFGVPASRLCHNALMFSSLSSWGPLLSAGEGSGQSHSFVSVTLP